MDHEDSWLASYAMSNRASRGRRFAEPLHAFRAPFQRDRERIVHSSAFRRMTGKTQVLVASVNDHHRTRLTHTLEVVQVARTVARRLRLNEDLTEAIALAHDIGHPPFGHAGEAALNECLAAFGGFNHNLYGLRRVDQLEERYPEFPGLNLSFELREAFEAELVPGPSLLVSGAPITTTGGHCWFMGGEADGEVELRKAVRQRVKDGCDWIKVMATGGNMTRGTNTLAAQYAVDELRAVIEEAHRLRRRVAAHCHGTAGIRVAVEAGVDTLEHCSFTGAKGVDFDNDLVREIAAKGLVISPTISVGYRSWADDGLKRQRAELTHSFFEAGCKVAMSTDCGIPRVPHAALGVGIEILQELGQLSPVAALRLATSTSADLLGLPDRGVLQPGKRADLLVVQGDPTRDLGALQQVRYVVKAGRLV